MHIAHPNNKVMKESRISAVAIRGGRERGGKEAVPFLTETCILYILIDSEFC